MVRICFKNENNAIFKNRIRFSLNVPSPNKALAPEFFPHKNSRTSAEIRYVAQSKLKFKSQTFQQMTHTLTNYS